MYFKTPSDTDRVSLTNIMTGLWMGLWDLGGDLDVEVLIARAPVHLEMAGAVLNVDVPGLYGVGMFYSPEPHVGPLPVEFLEDLMYSYDGEEFYNCTAGAVHKIDSKFLPNFATEEQVEELIQDKVPAPEKAGQSLVGTEDGYKLSSGYGHIFEPFEFELQNTQYIQYTDQAPSDDWFDEDKAGWGGIYTSTIPSQQLTYCYYHVDWGIYANTLKDVLYVPEDTIIEGVFIPHGLYADKEVEYVDLRYAFDPEDQYYSPQDEVEQFDERLIPSPDMSNYFTKTESNNRFLTKEEGGYEFAYVPFPTEVGEGTFPGLYDMINDAYESGKAIIINSHTFTDDRDEVVISITKTDDDKFNFTAGEHYFEELGTNDSFQSYGDFASDVHSVSISSASLDDMTVKQLIQNYLQFTGLIHIES